VRALRLVPAIVLALSAGGCARDSLVSTASAVPVGNWKVERQVDRITGAPLSSALLTTRSSSNTAVAFPQIATMQLLCFKSDPVVRIAFEFKVGSTQNSTLGYRFDDKPGHEIDARFIQDYKTVMIEDRAAVAQFVGELATSNALYVRIRSLNAGRSTAEFNLEGAPAAIEAALAGCPATPPAPPPQPAKPARKRIR
jgi:hypothetical protein